MRLGVVSLTRLVERAPKLPIIRPIIVCLGAIAIRFVVAVYSTVRHFSITMPRIPENWYRLTFATDLFHPPELVPGAETIDPQLTLATGADRIRYNSRKTADSQSPGTSSLALELRGGMLLWLLGYLPTLVWRMTFKSTCIVYLPLVWIAHRGANTNPSFRERVHMIKHAEIEKTRRALAWIVVIVQTAIPFAFALQVAQLIDGIGSSLGRELLHYSVVTTDIKLWHVARLSTAVITLGVFFWGDSMTRRMSDIDQSSDNHRVLLNSLIALRSVLSVYVIACCCTIVWRHVDPSEWTFRVWP